MAPARTDSGLALVTLPMTYRPLAKKTTAIQAPSSAPSPPRDPLETQNTGAVTGTGAAAGTTVARSTAAKGSGPGACACVMGCGPSLASCGVGPLLSHGVRIVRCGGGLLGPAAEV